MHFLSDADKPLTDMADKAGFKLDMIATLERQIASYNREVDDILKEAENYVGKDWSKEEVQTAKDTAELDKLS